VTDDAQASIQHALCALVERAADGDLRYDAATVSRLSLFVTTLSLAAALAGVGVATAQPGAPAIPAEPSTTPTAEAAPATQPSAPTAPAADTTDEGGGAPVARLELGGFLGGVYFGDDLELGNAWAGEQLPGSAFLLGARATLIAFPEDPQPAGLRLELGLEAETRLALSSTGSSDEGGRASYFAPVLGWRVHAIGRLRNSSGWTPHLVVGVGGETIFSGSPFIGDDTDAELHWGPGVSHRLFGRWDARLDLRHALTAGRSSTTTSTFEAHLGLSTGWDLGGGGGARVAPDADRDGDGILDRVDECPLQAETMNEFRDTDGCPDVADRDGDGVMDPDDRCVDEPETVNGVEDHDGCPEIDDDGDGLVGSRDQCAREAEDFDKFEDDDGCPEPDNDRDGVADATDVCPAEAETRNGYQDDDGCPDEIPEVVQQFTGTIEGITFATAKATIRPASKPTLDKAAAILADNPSVLIRIEGHTDDRGKRTRNLALSLERADAVRQYLVAKGISPERMITVGHGPDVPRDTNTTGPGRARNRRIEFHILVEPPRIMKLSAPAAAPAPPPAPP
jgi:OOP family OmpA-OmpF porin